MFCLPATPDFIGKGTHVIAIDATGLALSCGAQAKR